MPHLFSEGPGANLRVVVFPVRLGGGELGWQPIASTVLMAGSITRGNIHTARRPQYLDATT